MLIIGGKCAKGTQCLSLNIYLLKPPVNLQPSQYTSIEKYRRSSDGKKKSYYFYKKECLLDYMLLDTHLFLCLHEIVAQAGLTSFLEGAITEPSWFELRGIWPWECPQQAARCFILPIKTSQWLTRHWVLAFGASVCSCARYVQLPASYK